MDKRKLLRDKIEMECSQYCRNILRKRTGTFKDDVEKVETYKKLSRSAIRHCEDISEKGVEILLIFPNLLMYFYQKWIRQERSMDENVSNTIDKIITAYMQAESEENEYETSGIKGFLKRNGLNTENREYVEVMQEQSPE